MGIPAGMFEPASSWMSSREMFPERFEGSGPRGRTDSGPDLGNVDVGQRVKLPSSAWLSGKKIRLLGATGGGHRSSR